EPQRLLEMGTCVAGPQIGQGHRAVYFRAREVETYARGGFAEVAQDVGELEGDAALHGQFLGRVAALEAPDVDARQSDDAGDPVAVCIKLVEGREGYGREVLLLAGDDFVEDFARD